MIRNGQSSAGFSMVELLVAMTLGLILTSGMISVFSGNRQSSELNTAVSNMQENARFALDVMASDIRSAGFQGCLNVQSDVTVIRAAGTVPTTSFASSFANGSVIGANDSWSREPPPGFVKAGRDAVPGTHAITLQFGDADTRLLRKEMRVGGKPSPAGVVRLESALDGAKANDLAIISNCSQADIFRISALANGGKNLKHAAPDNATGNLSVAYGDVNTLKETTVTLFRSTVYYVADTGQTNDSGDEIRALYKQTLPYGDLDENPPVEIVSGIEDMRLAFGIRQSGGNLRYVLPTSSEYDSTLVESIRIGLLMSSRDRISSRDDGKTYTLAGQAIVPSGSSGASADSSHAGDRRHRLAFNTTVKIRNRRYIE